MIRFRLLVLVSATCLAALPLAAQTIALPQPPSASFTAPGEIAALPAPFTQQIDIELTGTSQPTGLIALRDGGMAFAAYQLGAIGRVDRDRKRVSYTPLGKAARPVSLIEAPDGTLYATDKALNVIHRIAPDAGEVSRITMPPDLPKLDLVGLRMASDGKLWFAGAAGWLGSHDPATGQTDVSSHDDLQGLGLGTMTETGAIIFVAGKAGRMIRIEPARTRFDSSGLPDGFRGARGISSSPEGDIWISSFRRNLIARQTGRGQWQIVTMPWPECQPQAILARADGTVLVADGGRRVLYRYTPRLDRFDEVGKLGDGGQIKAMIEIEGGIAIADMGADRIRIFLEEPQGN